MYRRHFISASTALAASCLGSRILGAKETQDRKFTMSLRGFSIGVRAGQRESIELAAKHGFEAVNADSRFLADLSQGELEELQALMKSKGVVWGSASLPVEFRQDSAKFQADLEQLAHRAAGLQRAGVTRVGTYLIPSHNELTYSQNMKQHADRLRKCSRILDDHGLRFGLEYVGPRTSLVAKRYPFLHTMAETKDLIAAIDVNGVGILLDSWHWYTAGETVDDLLTLTNDDVVACDLNDAPKGRKREEQIDNQRELPMATGVIDLGGFIRALVKIGYDGPVRAEPFNKRLNELENDAACATTARAIRSAFELAGA